MVALNDMVALIEVVVCRELFVVWARRLRTDYNRKEVNLTADGETS